MVQSTYLLTKTNKEHRTELFQKSFKFRLLSRFSLSQDVLIEIPTKRTGYDDVLKFWKKSRNSKVRLSSPSKRLCRIDRWRQICRSSLKSRLFEELGWSLRFDETSLNPALTSSILRSHAAFVFTLSSTLLSLMLNPTNANSNLALCTCAYRRSSLLNFPLFFDYLSNGSSERSLKPLSNARDSVVLPHTDQLLSE